MEIRSLVCFLNAFVSNALLQPFFLADMTEIEKHVRSIEADGLVWGSCKYRVSIKPLFVCLEVSDFTLLDPFPHEILHYFVG